MSNYILGAAISPHPPAIIGEIGGGKELLAFKTVEGVKRLSKEIRSLEPETIIIVSPHGTAFRDALSILCEEELYGDFASFGYENLKYTFQNDIELVREIFRKAQKNRLPIVGISDESAEQYNVNTDLDHGFLVPMHFIDEELEDYKVVSITYGFLEGEELAKFGEIIRQAAIDLNRKTLLIASGDLSHRLIEDGPYPYSESGQVFDDEIVRILEDGELEDFVNFDKSISEPAGECGLRCFQIMTGFLRNDDLESEIYSYEGPFGVGYLTSLLKTKSVDLYTKLAELSLEHYVKHRTVIDTPDNLPPELTQDRAGCFVTLHLDGELRGCIGTISPTRESLAEEIIQNAVSAGIYDPRFREVAKEELDKIEYSVDVLFPPERVANKDELDVADYGVIVSKDNRKGLLLPNLEGIDTVEKQLQIALSKAGISPDEDYEVERFRVIRHENTN